MNAIAKNPKVYQCKRCKKLYNEADIGRRPLQKSSVLYCEFCQCEQIKIHTIGDR